MRLTIHRGCKEIGGSCVELATDSTKIIIDVGLPLVDADREPFDRTAYRDKSLPELLKAKVAPPVPGLFMEGNRPNAILLSHAHLDHVGLLEHTPEDVPVYATAGTSKMMLAGGVFAGQKPLPRDRHQEITDRKTFEVGDIKVTPFSVDHSCYGAMAFLVEANGRKLLYSGDLRFHGRKPGMIKSLIKEVAPMKIDALVMEGTHFGSQRPARKTEYELEDDIVEHIRTAPGLVLASFSPIDVDRLVTYLKASMRTGRTFVVDAYTAFVMYLVHKEIKLPDPRSADCLRVYYNQSFQRRNNQKLQDMFARNRIELNEVLASPEQHVLCFRTSNLRLDFEGQLPEKLRVLYSYWSGYLEKPDWVDLQKHLADVGGDFIPAHTSGHIYVEDIIRFVEGIDAKSMFPIHTFEPDKFADYFPSVHCLNDSETITIG